MAVILAGEGLNYSYVPDEQVLHAVDIAVHEQSVMYLLGHNGCGKTTLLEILSGLRTPHQGTVTLNGKNIYHMPSHKRAQRVGLVPQMHTPVFAYTVREVVLMGRTPYLRFLGAPNLQDYTIVDEALKTVGLTDLQHRPYTDLSGGERQLTLIARGLAQQTDILLLDEPAAHLDPRNQHLVLETIVALAKHQEVSFVITSHNPNSALLYADQVIVMKTGRVVASGTPAEVLTEKTLSKSYDMPVEVIYNEDHVARAVVPRRSNGQRQLRQAVPYDE
ncbi:MAG: ABC transporter ATP-binding protein [Chloroflexi bacterium]|nr:ABC transporter ATP-binding protein [Chloroflexota bacterium]